MIDFFLTYQPLLSQILIYSLLTMGMFLWFRSGLFSMASSGLMAVGAYVSAIGMLQLHLPFWISALLAVAVAVVLALIVAVLALRLHHAHFALATLAFSELIRLLVLNWESLTMGAQGISGIPPATKLWQLILAVAITAYVMARLSGNTKFGRAMNVMREDQILANTSAVYTNLYRVVMFIIGAVPTALAGVFLAHSYMYISPEQFGATIIFNLLLMVVIGGSASWIGAIVGAGVISLLPEIIQMSKQYLLLINGLILLAITIFMPNGIAGLRLWKRKRLKAIIKPLEQGSGNTQVLPFSASVMHQKKVSDNKIILTAEGINVSFGGLKVLKDVSFSVREGEVFGIIGPNGAGKTTMFNVISGIVPPTAGRLLWEGGDVTRLRPDQLCRLGISRTYQNIRLNKEMTVFDNIMVGAHKTLSYGLFGTLFYSKKSRREEKEAREKIWKVLKRLGMEEYAAATAGSLAYGLQRRVEVARALVSEPRLLLLDEPTSGMNEAETEEFGEFIKELRNAGETIILVEHHIPLVADTCDQVLVLNFGVPIAIGTPAEIQIIPEVIEAYLGTENVGKVVAQ